MDAPFCKDCRYCMPSSVNGFSSAKCAVAPKRDPVTGEQTFFYCGTERASMIATDCGPDGRLFEPALLTA